MFTPYFINVRPQLGPEMHLEAPEQYEGPLLEINTQADEIDVYNNYDNHHSLEVRRMIRRERALRAAVHVMGHIQGLGDPISLWVDHDTGEYWGLYPVYYSEKACALFHVHRIVPASSGFGMYQAEAGYGTYDTVEEAEDALDLECYRVS